MKKIKFLIIGAALLACMGMLAGCGGTESEDTLPADTEAAETTAADTSITLDMYRIVYPEDCNRSLLEQISSFAQTVQTKYGCEIGSCPDTEAETELEIVVGKAKREGADVGTTEYGYGSYGVKISGRKLFLYYTETDYIEKCFTLLEGMLKADGDKVLIEMEEQNKNVSDILNLLPVYGDGSYSDILYSGENTYQVSVPVTTEEEYTAYLAKLEENGYKKYTDNIVGGNLFATYTNDKYEINTSFSSTSKRTRVLIEPTGYLPDTSTPAYTKVRDAAVTQMKLTTPGLSLVVSLEDGRFVIIDGGASSSEDAETLYKFISEQAPAGEKPHIIWIFTHAHGDHVSVPKLMMQLHGNDICIDMLVCNFPDFDAAPYAAMTESSDAIVNAGLRAANLLIQAATLYGDIPVFRCHAGQKLMLPGCEIQFLMTHENTGIGKYSWINSTSTVFRITLGSKGTSVLVLADQEPSGICDTLNALYGDYLKSDILQVAHHGYSGGSLKLYQTVSPSICFWPITPDKFDTPRRKGYSDDGTKIINEGQYFLRFQLEGVTHYHTGETVTIQCP